MGRLPARLPRSCAMSGKTAPVRPSRRSAGPELTPSSVPAMARPREVSANATGRLPGTVLVVTSTTHTGWTTTVAHPLASSWLETAVSILQASSLPLNARQIVAVAHAARYRPRSQTRTPVQSVNRDLRAAVRRGDPRVVLGPGPGQFTGIAAAAGPPTRRSRKSSSGLPQLPVEPLETLIASRGGLRACGVRHQPGDTIERVRWAARLQRAYLRARRRGWISIHTADELAVKALGAHPCSVWGVLWWDIG